jgi:hypothetical protein
MHALSIARPLVGLARFIPWMLQNTVRPLWFKLKTWLRPRRRRILLMGFERSFVAGFKLRTSWGEIEHYLLTKEQEVASLGFSAAVGVGIGGTILAALVAGNLGQDAVALGIDRQVRYLEGRRRVQLLGLPNEQDWSELIRGKVVLAVSAELVSGETVELLLEELRNSHPRRIYIFCVDWHEASNIKPDFWYNHIASGPKNKYNIIHKPWKISPTYGVDEGKQRQS